MPATRTAALQLPPLLVGVAAGVALFGGYHESNLPYLLLLLGCAYLAWERFRREDELAATTGSAAAPQKPKTPALWTASPWTPTPPSPTPSTMPAALTTVSFTVNGASRVVDAGAAATTDLVSYLRYNELLTGTKISCHEGGCGACTVLLLRPGESEAVPVNACLRKLASCDGCAITTVEGLGTVADPNAFQKIMVEKDATQCGFCSPGIVVSMAALLRANPTPTAQQVEDAFDGNLCRCTGYRRILDAAQQLVAENASLTPEEAVRTAAASAAQHAACDIEDGPHSCGATPLPKQAGARHRRGACAQRKDANEQTTHRGTERTKCTPHHAATLCTSSGVCADTQPRVPLVPNAHAHTPPPAWIVPASLAELTPLLSPTARLVGAGTGAGVAKYYEPQGVPVSRGGPLPALPAAYVDVSAVAELTEFGVASGTGALTIGAATTLKRLYDYAAEQVHDAPLGGRWKTFYEHMHKIANHQVRSVGTVGGNLMLGNLYDTFPSDIGLLFEALGTHASVADATGQVRTLSIGSFLSIDMTSKALVSFTLPAAKLSAGQRELLFAHKVMLRKVNSHAIVNFALRLVVTPADRTIVSATIRYGGIARGQYVPASAAESVLCGMVLGDNTALQSALTALDAVAAQADPVFGRDAFRTSLVYTLFYKGMLQAAAALDKGTPPPALATCTGSASVKVAKVAPTFGAPIVPPSLCNAASVYERPVSKGVWEVNGGQTPGLYPITQGGHHKPKALQQVSGAAPFTDDMPQPAGQLHGVFVLSHAIGTLTGLDTSAAAAVSGVVAIITAQTLAQHHVNNMLAADCTEQVLADSAVPYMGCRLALVLARTQQVADEATRLVVAHITPLPHTQSTDLVVTLEQAVATRSFFSDTPQVLQRGDATSVMASADHVISGRASCAFQYHFHMETQVVRAASDGNGGVLLTGAMQAPTHTAASVSSALGLNANQVECRTARSGGGFGAKYTRTASLAVAAAAACKIVDAPVSIMLSLNDNMASLGGRRPHLWDYEIGCTKEGRILAVQGTTYSLQGNTSDLGHLTNGGELWDVAGAEKYEGCSIDGPYHIANWNLQGYCAQTHLLPLTYMRGPYRLPGHILIESAVDAIAATTGLPAHAVREINLYKEGDVTPCGQHLVDNNLHACVAAAKKLTDFETLEASVSAFNASSRYVKQGLALSPIRFAVQECTGFSAVVAVRSDATVVVQQSGTELGQGLYEKQAQCAAYSLNCPLHLVAVDGVTSKICTGPGTEASKTSEGNVASTRLACEKVVSAMAPAAAALRESLKREPTWAELVAECVRRGIEMRGHGTYTGQVEKGILPGMPVNGHQQYEVYGCAITRVRYDALAAELTVLSATVVTDQGTSLNPNIDAGQSQGAFVQALGYLTSEELNYGPDGTNLSNGTWEYKVPSQLDIPVEFNIHFLGSSVGEVRKPNPQGVFGSKSAGEPSMLAANSALSAIRHAVHELRRDEGHTSYAALDAPATCEAICGAIDLDPTRFSF